MVPRNPSGPPANLPSGHGIQSTWLKWGWGVQLLLGMKKVKSREGWLQGKLCECEKQPVFGGLRSSLILAENIEVSKLMGELSKKPAMWRRPRCLPARGSSSKSCPATKEALEEPPSLASPWLRLSFPFKFGVLHGLSSLFSTISDFLSPRRVEE